MPKATERAAEDLERMRRRAPSRVANASRNARTGRGRRRRWQPARDALWDLVEPAIEGANAAAGGDSARVAVVGAGNCDDLPLRRIAERADSVTLVDIDPRAARGAVRKLSRAKRRKVEVIGHDITEGAADAIVLATSAADAPGGTVDPTGAKDRPGSPPSPAAPLPGGPYDLVIGDLFYSQLLYPALLDLGVDAERIDEVIAAHAASLTRDAVARLHASAPQVVHIHDPLAWWDGHEQPVALEEVLDLADDQGSEAALALVAQGVGPYETDPCTALADLGIAPITAAFWHWPFTEGVDYLAVATLTASLPQDETRRAVETP